MFLPCSLSHIIQSFFQWLHHTSPTFSGHRGHRQAALHSSLLVSESSAAQPPRRIRRIRADGRAQGDMENRGQRKKSNDKSSIPRYKAKSVHWVVYWSSKIWWTYYWKEKGCSGILYVQPCPHFLQVVVVDVEVCTWKKALKPQTCLHKKQLDPLDSTGSSWSSPRKTTVRHDPLPLTSLSLSQEWPMSEKMYRGLASGSVPPWLQGTGELALCFSSLEAITPFWSTKIFGREWGPNPNVSITQGWLSMTKRDHASPDITFEGDVFGFMMTGNKHGALASCREFCFSDHLLQIRATSFMNESHSSKLRPLKLRKQVSQDERPSQSAGCSPDKCTSRILGAFFRFLAVDGRVNLHVSSWV